MADQTEAYSHMTSTARARRPRPRLERRPERREGDSRAESSSGGRCRGVTGECVQLKTRLRYYVNELRLVTVQVRF